MRLGEAFEAHQARSDVGRGPVGLDEEQPLAAGLTRESAGARHALIGVRRDQRSHEHARLEGRADLQAAQDPGQLLAKGVGDGPLDEDPPRAGAALPGGGGDRERGLGGGEVEVGVAAHYDRVVASHLQRQQLARLVEGRLAQGAAHGVGAGEEHRFDVGVHRERAPRIGAALHDLEHAVGQAGPPPQAHRPRADGGREVAGLEHDGVAGREGGHDVSVGQVRGEVEGAQHGQYAAGMEGGAGAGSGFDGRHVAHARIEGGVDLGRKEGGLAAGVPQGLAHLPRDELRELVAPRGGGLAEAVQDFGARREAGVAPGGERASRAGHGSVDGVGVSDLEAADLVVGVGGRRASK
jgi:hypothetical protein